MMMMMVVEMKMHMNIKMNLKMILVMNMMTGECFFQIKSPRQWTVAPARAGTWGKKKGGPLVCCSYGKGVCHWEVEIPFFVSQL